MLIRSLIPSVFFLFVISACQNNSGSSVSIQSAEMGLPKLPEGFEAFYQKFHSDSLYQMQHINWPLAGKRTVQGPGGELLQEPATWEKGNWRIQQAVDFGKGDYVQEVQNVGDVMVIEKIKTKVANFGLERRFAKNGENDWQLIFYADMHQLAKGE